MSSVGLASERHAWAALVLCAFSACGMFAVGVWAWRRRNAAIAARSFAALCFTGTVWNLIHLAELASASLAAKVFWDALGTIPAVASTFLALVFAAEYTGRRLPRWLIAGALVTITPPTLVVAAASWGDLRASAHLEPPYGGLAYDLTGWDFAYLLQAVAVSAVALALLVAHWIKQPRAFRRQAGAIVAAFAVPIVFDFTWIFLNLRLQGERDISHATFAASALLLGWALGRAQLFDLVPVARHAIFDNLTDAVLVLDRLRRVVDANRAATVLFERRFRELVGRPLEAALPHWPALSRAADDADPRTTEMAAPAARAGRWYETRWTPLVKGEIGWMGGTLVLRDVTDLHEGRVVLEQRVQHSSDELAASEGRFRALFDQTFQLIGILDRAGNLLAANRASLDMIGADEDAVLGKPFWQTPWWTHDEAQARGLRDGIARAAAGEFVRFEATHVDSDRKLRVIDFSLSPVRDAREHVVQIIPEGRDLTALQEARASAARLAVQLQQAQKMEAIGRLAGSVAHDFNNLLIVMSGSIGIAKQRLAPDSEVGTFLDEALQATATAAGITRQLLTFSRQHPTAPRRLDVAQALDEIQGILRRLAGAAAPLEIRLQPALGAVYLDPTQLQQVLINLVVNARDAMPEGGTICIGGDDAELTPEAAAAIPDGRAGRFVRLSVRDTGRGMNEEVRARIFEPFFTTKPDAGGTGLGLAVVHGIVHQAGGFVDVATEPGHGSMFFLYFPVAG